MALGQRTGARILGGAGKGRRHSCHKDWLCTPPSRLVVSQSPSRVPPAPPFHHIHLSRRSGKRWGCQHVARAGSWVATSTADKPSRMRLAREGPSAGFRTPATKNTSRRRCGAIAWNLRKNSFNPKADENPPKPDEWRRWAVAMA